MTLRLSPTSLSSLWVILHSYFSWKRHRHRWAANVVRDKSKKNSQEQPSLSRNVVMNQEHKVGIL